MFRGPPTRATFTLVRTSSLLLLICAACSSNGPFEAGPDEVDDTAAATVDVKQPPKAPEGAGAKAPPKGKVRSDAGSELAVVRLSKEKRDKDHRLVFTGVTLERAGKAPLVVSYSQDELWSAFDGKEVRVKSHPYAPEGRAIGGEHATVDELWLTKDEPGTTYFAFETVEDVAGKLELPTDGPAKFVDGEGVSYTVLKLPQKAEAGAVTLARARKVEHSSHAAKGGGPFLWIDWLKAR